MPALLLLSVILPMVGSCRTISGDGISTSDARAASILVACASFQPITWSSKDTPQTIREAKAHNAAGKAVCHWGKK